MKRHTYYEALRDISRAIEGVIEGYKSNMEEYTQKAVDNPEDSYALYLAETYGLLLEDAEEILKTMKL